MSVRDRYDAFDVNGLVVREGDIVTNFRGHVDTFHYVSAAPDAGRSGKVTTDRGEFYPQVFNLTLRER